MAQIRPCLSVSRVIYHECYQVASLYMEKILWRMLLISIDSLQAATRICPRCRERVVRVVRGGAGW